MRRITSKNWASQSFIDWLEDNKDAIREKIDDNNCTGDNLWDFFRSNKTEYEELKKTLVEDQGNICCYCGRRISIDSHTSIEHVFPKSNYKYLTLNFENLLASCSGGAKQRIHPVQLNETLEEISLIYDVDSKDIEHYYKITPENKIARITPRKIDLKQLKGGDKLIVFPVLHPREQHCDHKKGKNEIPIHPLQNTCESHFKFNPSDGRIFVPEKREENPKLFDTVKYLGLNTNRYINQRRRDVIAQATQLKQLLLREKDEFHTRRIELIKNLKKIPNSGKFEPFIFVKISSL